MKVKRPFSGFYIFGICCWIAMLVFCGTHIRNRALDQVPTLDWVILVQLILAASGALFGLILFRRYGQWGTGTIALVIYLIAAGLSAFGSLYPTTVIGYWVLLAGGVLLTVGLVKASDSLEQLMLLEKCWLYVMTILIAKDAFISFIVANASSGDMYRLGFNVTHPVTLSFYAVLAFFVSFRQNRSHRYFWWLIRCGYVLVILLARTRMSILALLVGTFIMVWVHSLPMDQKGRDLRLVTVFGGLALMATAILAANFGSQMVHSMFMAFSRGQDLQEMMTLSSRIDVWPVALNRFLENPLRIAIGHGYGISRLVFLEDFDTLLWNVANAHNTMLEFLVCMGLPGGICCLFIYWAGLRWHRSIQTVAPIFTFGFASRAVIIISIIFLSSLTESALSTKIDPLQILLFYYLVAFEQKDRLPVSKLSLERLKSPS